MYAGHICMIIDRDKNLNQDNYMYKKIDSLKILKNNIDRIKLILYKY